MFSLIFCDEIIGFVEQRVQFLFLVAMKHQCLTSINQTQGAVRCLHSHLHTPLHEHIHTQAQTPRRYLCPTRHLDRALSYTPPVFILHISPFLSPFSPSPPQYLAFPTLTQRDPPAIDLYSLFYFPLFIHLLPWAPGLKQVHLNSDGS